MEYKVIGPVTNSSFVTHQRHNGMPVDDVKLSIVGMRPWDRYYFCHYCRVAILLEEDDA